MPWQSPPVRFKGLLKFPGWRLPIPDKPMSRRGPLGPVPAPWACLSDLIPGEPSPQPGPVGAPPGNLLSLWTGRRSCSWGAWPASTLESRAPRRHCWGLRGVSWRANLSFLWATQDLCLFSFSQDWLLIQQKEKKNVELLHYSRNYDWAM